MTGPPAAAPPLHPTIEQIRQDFQKAKKVLRAIGVPQKLIASIETKALRTGRKQTGEHATNRQSRWTINPANPQYASESDSRTIFIILCAMMFEFQNAPPLPDEARPLFEPYLGKTIKPGVYQDALLLEKLDYHRLRDDSLAPQHGYGIYHIGHQDPTRSPTCSGQHRLANFTQQFDSGEHDLARGAYLSCQADWPVFRAGRA